MKILKFFIFFIMFPIACFTQDLNVLMANIEQAKNHINQSKNNLNTLLETSEKLQTYLPLLKECVKNENEKISAIAANLTLLDDVEKEQNLLRKKNQILADLKKEKDQMIFCDFLISEIKNTEQVIQSYYLNIYQNSFNNKSENIFLVFKDAKQNDYVKVNFLTIIRSSIKRNLNYFMPDIVQVLIILTLVFLKLVNIIRIPLFNKLSVINLERLTYVVVLLMLISPVRFVLFNILYSKNNQYLLTFLERPVEMLLIYFISLYYMYKNFKQIRFKDTILAMLIFISSCLFFYLNFKLFYFELHHFSDNQILKIKYSMLFSFEIVILCILGVLYFSILDIKHLNALNGFIFFGFLFFIFVLGLYGYIDLALNTNYIVAIDLYVIFFVIFFRKIKTFFLENLYNNQSVFKKFVTRLFSFNANKVLLNVKVLIYLEYFYLNMVCSCLFIFVNFWMFPKNQFESFFNFFFKNYNFEQAGFSLRWDNISRGTLIFVCLNIINYSSATYFAKKMSKQVFYQKKISFVSSLIGYFVTTIITLKIVGAKLSTLVVFSTSFLLTFILITKDIMKELIENLLIYVNKPYKVGDFIEIDNKKGFVKKIALVETIIESLDKNIVRIPNKSISNSLIEIFKFQDKTLHRINMNYLINQFDPKYEVFLKQQLTQIAQNSPSVIYNIKHPIQVLFLPQSQSRNSYTLKITFLIKNFKKLNQTLDEINKDIINALHHLNLDVEFINLKH